MFIHLVSQSRSSEIEEGETRKIHDASDGYISLYECHMDIEDANEYLEIVKG